MKIEETIAKYGYDPTKLGNFSLRLIIFECEFCLNNYENRITNMNRSNIHSCEECFILAKIYHQKKLTEDKHEFWKNKENNIPKKKITIKCEFCLNEFEYKVRYAKSSKTKSCKDCNAIASLYTSKKLTEDKHEFWKIRYNKPSSHLRAIFNCEFCLEDFETTHGVVNNGSGFACCKKCDGIAAHYSRIKSAENKHEFYLKRRPTLEIICLDIEATFQKYGYTPHELSPFSPKRIVAKCKYCDIRIDLPMSKFSSREGLISCWGCMRQKTVETLQKKYGVECTLDIPSVKDKLANPKTEQIVEAILSDYHKIEYTREHSIGPYSFDFYIPSRNLLIEIQGDFFHGFKEFGYEGLPKDKAKSSYIEKYTNHKLIWVWEHEIHTGRINDILNNHIQEKTEQEINIKSESLTIKQIDNQEAYVFLSNFHHLGNLGTIPISFGAYHEDLLVAVCVFGGFSNNHIKRINSAIKQNHGPKEIRELKRFCVRPNILIDELVCLEEFIKIFLKNNNSVKIILNYFNLKEKDLNNHGWQKIENPIDSYHYVDNNQILTKRTVKDLARNNHMTEEDFASKANLIKFEAPKQIYVKCL